LPELRDIRSYRVPFVMSILLLLIGAGLAFWIRPDRRLQASNEAFTSTESLEAQP
jgi:hypothetical protein